MDEQLQVFDPQFERQHRRQIQNSKHFNSFVLNSTFNTFMLEAVSELAHSAHKVGATSLKNSSFTG